jgi:hypothetical protein
MSEARADERMRIANLVEDMIHEDLREETNEGNYLD